MQKTSKPQLKFIDLDIMFMCQVWTSIVFVARKDAIASGSNRVAAAPIGIEVDRALTGKDTLTVSPKSSGCQAALYANQSTPRLGTEAGKLDQSSRICKILRRFGSSDACHGGWESR